MPHRDSPHTDRPGVEQEPGKYRITAVFDDGEATTFFMLEDRAEAKKPTSSAKSSSTRSTYAPYPSRGRSNAGISSRKVANGSLPKTGDEAQFKLICGLLILGMGCVFLGHVLKNRD